MSLPVLQPAGVRSFRVAYCEECPFLRPRKRLCEWGDQPVGPRSPNGKTPRPESCALRTGSIVVSGDPYREEG